MTNELLSVLLISAVAFVLLAMLIYLDIITEYANEIREIAQSYGWADMDKAGKLDGKRYTPATDADFFIMPDGTKIHRH